MNFIKLHSKLFKNNGKMPTNFECQSNLVEFLKQENKASSICKVCMYNCVFKNFDGKIEKCVVFFIQKFVETNFSVLLRCFFS